MSAREMENIGGSSCAKSQEKRHEEQRENAPELGGKAKKIPNRKRDPGCPILHRLCWTRHRPRGVAKKTFQAGLLTSGSSYWPRLPGFFVSASDFMRCSSPITAAGPSPISTAFPFQPHFRGNLNERIRKKKSVFVKPYSVYFAQELPLLQMEGYDKEKVGNRAQKNPQTQCGRWF